jgi:hypothetical protein
VVVLGCGLLRVEAVGFAMWVNKDVWRSDLLDGLHRHLAVHGIVEIFEGGPFMTGS